MDSRCERCKDEPPTIRVGPWAGQRGLHNFCTHCSKNLCADCMAKGRCRQSPTKKHEAAPEE